MNYHRDLCSVSGVCAALLSVNGGAQARPKVKTKWPMNVRGEDLSQAPPALRNTPEERRVPLRSLLLPYSLLYIRCPSHADANYTRTVPNVPVPVGSISCFGISLVFGPRSTSDRISGDNYRLACKYAESIRTSEWN